MNLLLLGSEKFCHHKCHFSLVKKCKLREMSPFQQCMTVTAVSLFYEVLPKQFEAFGFNVSQEKTGNC